MDVPEPPQIVLEQPAPCADVQSAESAFRKVVGASVAPRPAWTVTVRFSRSDGGLSAEGLITDDLGSPVSHREMRRDASVECTSLARAVGVWASLVLDAEVARAAAVAKSEPHGAPPPRPSPSPLPPSADLWPAPVVNEKPPPEASMLLAHPEGQRTIELGMTSLLMGGVGAGIVAGPAAFAVIEVGKGWFLRPTVAIARTLQNEQTPAGSATWGAARFDACGRLPGMYHEHRGIQLDFCGGAEVGYLQGDGWVIPVAAVGPSLGLRGELAGDLSAMVRGVAELNVLHTTTPANVDPGLFAGRAEVGLSWRIR